MAAMACRAVAFVHEDSNSIGHTPHLPKQPVQAFDARGGRLWQECPMLLREVEQDGARLEDTCGRRCRVVPHGGDLAVGVEERTVGCAIA